MTIWESDEACVEAREAVMAKATKATHSRPMSATAREVLREHKTALDAYATAVAVCCLEEVLAVGDKDAVRDQVVLLLEQIKAKGVVK